VRIFFQACVFIHVDITPPHYQILPVTKKPFSQKGPGPELQISFGSARLLKYPM
jgi:hypothetical protein